MPKAASTTTTNRARTNPAKKPDPIRRRDRNVTASTTKKTAPRSRRAMPKEDAERIPPIMLPFTSVEDDCASEVQTIFGLIEALGGAEAIGRVMPGSYNGNATENVLDWARKGFISPALHLRLYGLAIAAGKTVHPSVFGMTSDTPGWQGMLDIHNMVLSMRRAPPRRR